MTVNTSGLRNAADFMKQQTGTDTSWLSNAADEIDRLRFFVDWVDSIVSNPVSSYSTAALDGLFGMTRDRIAALSNGEQK